ncbi:MAG: LacI family transcriptional regulator [Candidatus Anaerobiospirillum merdipullorum]|uniref:LacI family transcriptional regulator n=1 Tax=Candidatus Anaerobiospirillum merdipullorum TaxID=2838450 RepID=A0A9E2KPI1_9GAMM|nr:LacI family transcriptional regulator [Candidatus Anaerobiospirillum merdipullorum]
MAGVVSIAKALNISPSTVSRALSRPGMVAPKTRELILQEAKKQGYLSENVAPFLSAQPPCVGVLLADLNNTFSARILNAVLEVIYSSDYNAVVGSSNEDPLKESHQLKQWQSLNLKGLIAMPTANFAKAYAHLTNVPLILVDRDVPELNATRILVDNEAGAKLCIEHLLQQGFNKILLVSGSHNVYTFKKRSEAAKLAYPDIECIELKAVSYEELYMGAFELMNVLMLRTRDKRPNAIVACNNALAAGLLYAINLKQLKMPDDIALVSFGDSEWARFYPTSISALRMPAEDLGRMAAEEMLTLLSQDNYRFNTRLLSPMLMPRASSLALK